MLQGFVGIFLVRVPLVLLLSRVPDVTLFQIGLGTPASSLVQILLCVGLFLFLERRERKLRPACRWEWLPTGQGAPARAARTASGVRSAHSSVCSGSWMCSR